MHAQTVSSRPPFFDLRPVKEANLIFAFYLPKSIIHFNVQVNLVCQQQRRYLKCFLVSWSLGNKQVRTAVDTQIIIVRFQCCGDVTPKLIYFLRGTRVCSESPEEL